MYVVLLLLNCTRIETLPSVAVHKNISLKVTCIIKVLALQVRLAVTALYGVCSTREEDSRSIGPWVNVVIPLKRRTAAGRNSGRSLCCSCPWELGCPPGRQCVRISRTALRNLQMRAARATRSVEISRRCKGTYQFSYTYSPNRAGARRTVANQRQGGALVIGSSRVDRVRRIIKAKIVWQYCSSICFYLLSS